MHFKQNAKTKVQKKSPITRAFLILKIESLSINQEQCKFSLIPIQ